MTGESIESYKHKERALITPKQMASVFIKVPVSERLPKESGGIIGYCDTADILQQLYFDSKKGIFHDPLDDEETPMRVTIFLEEIELPTEEEIRKAGLGNFTEDDINDVYGEFIDDDRRSFVNGANYILKKLKGS